MIFQMRVVAADIGVTIYEGKERQAHRSIGFQLIPDDPFDRLELETGEVFGRSYRDSEKIRIPMSMGVYPRSDESSDERQISKIWYWESRQATYEFGDSAPALNVTQYLKPQDFEDLLSNLKNGLIPSTITIYIGFKPFEEQGPISYGNAPDGSELIWKNKDKENQSVELENIEFAYQLLSPQKDEDGITDPYLEGELPVTRIARIEEHLRRVRLSLNSLEDIIKYLKWMFYLVAGLTAFWASGTFR